MAQRFKSWQYWLTVASGPQIASSAHFILGFGHETFGTWAERSERPLRSLKEVKLLALLRKAPGRNALIEFCVGALRFPRGRIAIGEPERRTGYSRRYLDRPFDRYAGLSPKVGGSFRFQTFCPKMGAMAAM